MPIALNFLLVLSLVSAFALASPLFGARRRMDGQKGMPYETGMPPIGLPGHRIWASYYRFAVLFVVFDVDLAFLVPWLLLGRRPDVEMLLTLTLFLGLVSFTLAYVWRKKALEI